MIEQRRALEAATPAADRLRPNPYSPSSVEAVQTTRRPRTWLPLAILAAVIVFGSWVRTANLGALEFNNDELYHYYAAQALSEGRGPQLPSGHIYDRGLDITRLVAASNQLLSSPEFATRLPSAIFGIANLVLIAAIGWAIGGPWTAVGATLMLAVLPEAVTQSRQLRFYTYQLCFGLIALFAVWKLVEGAGRRVLHDRRTLILQLVWAAALGWALLMATRVQITTLSVAAGGMVALLFAALLDLRAHGRLALTHSVPVLAWGAAVLTAAVMALLRPEIVAELVFRARYVPLWAERSGGHPLSYYYSLVESYPAVIALLPAIFLAVALRNVRLCVVLLAWFAVPLALHSFAFAWKGDRFVLLALPALLLAAAVAITEGGQRLHRTLAERLRATSVAAHAATVAAAAIATVAVFALMTTPAFNAARKAPHGALTVQQHDWRSIGERVRQAAAGQDVPVGTSEGMSALYYWGHADFLVHIGASEFGGQMLETGAPDKYSGVPVYVTADAIRKRFEHYPYVLIGLDRLRWENGLIHPELKETLRSEAVELCGADCGGMLLFRWPMPGISAEASSSSAATSL